MDSFYSQKTEYLPIQQDKFVCKSLNFKRNGTFLDIGCHDYKRISNTYYLEKELNWAGIGIDIDSQYKEGWDLYRKSPYILADAVTLDYQKLLSEHNMPEIIDYLSIDIEPPLLTLEALYKVFQSNYSFNIITFETDYYREVNTRVPSRKFLIEKGFKIIRGSYQDDYYIHSRVIN